MSEQNYPGLALVENFLNKINPEKIDLTLEAVPNQPKKEQEKE